MARPTFVAFDCETTGLGAESGHRVIEFAALTYDLTGRKLAEVHSYVDPEREVDYGAYRVHGKKWSMLKGYPKFETLAQHLFECLSGKVVVIHNAPFDLAFLRAEFRRAGLGQSIREVAKVVDTLEVSRRLFSSGGHRLDDLVTRLGLPLVRPVHGAKVDATLLASAYVELVRRYPNVHPQGYAVR
jgi:DNA polymerase-3 subunit epsilon